MVKELGNSTDDSSEGGCGQCEVAVMIVIAVMMVMMRGIPRRIL